MNIAVTALWCYSEVLEFLMPCCALLRPGVPEKKLSTFVVPGKPKFPQIFPSLPETDPGLPGKIPILSPCREGV